jgi:hypothetical protein
VSTTDVTVSWSILASPASGKNMLVKFNPARITLHHNLFVKSLSRNPSVSMDNVDTPALDTTVDMRNNLVYDWGLGSGTQIHDGAHANVVANFYSDPTGASLDKEQALSVCTGDCPNEPNNIARAYVAANFSADDLDFDLNSLGTETEPFPAAPVTTTDACEAAYEVRDGAGVRPLDALDAQLIAGITLPVCVSDLAVPALSGPTSAQQGSTITVTDRVENFGTRSAENVTVRYHLSKNTTLEASDAVIGERTIAALVAGATDLGTSPVTIPTGIPGGSYVIIAKADATDAIIEANEKNNTKTRSIKILGADLIVSALTTPSTVVRGTVMSIRDSTDNRGDAAAPPTVTRFYLRSKAGVETLVGSRDVPALGPGGRSGASTNVVVPATLAAGSYTVVARADSDEAVVEIVETNNTRLRSITLQ